MKKSEEVAYCYLLEKGYKEEDIQFNPTRTIDFICSDKKQYEVKSLVQRRILVFTQKQWQTFKKTDVQIIVVHDGSVIDAFSFCDLEKAPYKPYIIEATGELRPYVNAELIQQIKKKFSETKGMSVTGVVDWALRYLMKLQARRVN